MQLDHNAYHYYSPAELQSITRDDIRAHAGEMTYNAANILSDVVTLHPSHAEIVDACELSPACDGDNFPERVLRVALCTRAVDTGVDYRTLPFMLA